MSPLSQADRERILDYCLGQLPADEEARVATLVNTHPEARELRAAIQRSLQPLNTSDLLEPCPDALAEMTVSRLRAAAGTEAKALGDLIAREQAHAATVRIPLWHRVTQMAAIAAIVVVSLSVAVPMLRRARVESYQRRCAAQLRVIGRGMAAYQNDNGSLPTVTMASGSPWWRVGDQGDENVSNTRAVWLLASQSYVSPENFVCPGRLQLTAAPNFQDLPLSDLRDFPSKSYLNYSPRVCRAKVLPDAQAVLLADNNPLCESIPSDSGQRFVRRLDEALLTRNSLNHSGRGQNLLTADGAAAFSKTRRLGADQDDIYSLEGMRPGVELTGCEQPSCDTDTFLAP